MTDSKANGLYVTRFLGEINEPPSLLRTELNAARSRHTQSLEYVLRYALVLQSNFLDSYYDVPSFVGYSAEAGERALNEKCVREIQRAKSRPG